MNSESDNANDAATIPRVAIGLPVYNGEKYLAEAIESVLGQTCADFQLVISDNASTDATQEICREFAARDRRVRYARAEQNRGAAWNFNRTFELSDGEYFKWLAHDDVIGPRYLERALDVMDRDSSLVLCHSRTGIVDGQGELIADPGSDDPKVWELQGISPEMEGKRLEMGRSAHAYQRYLGILLYSIRNHEVFGVIRRSVMRTTALHRAYRGGEKVFLSELSLRGAFHEIPEVLSFSRWHDDRFSSNASARAQNLHVNPKLSRRLALPRQFRATGGYFGAVARSDLNVAQRAGCLLALLRFVLQVKKWKTVAADYLGGAGQLAKLPESPSAEAKQSSNKRHWTSLNRVSAASVARGRPTV